MRADLLQGALISITFAFSNLGSSDFKSIKSSFTNFTSKQIDSDLVKFFRNFVVSALVGCTKNINSSIILLHK
ncbi:hypothetical protein BpHYR1_038656 [Brachionus plicatilis]|uniref:Uncharacterized protein n=1 Tax=Brachionus plicatilis TaxID=10195 RepID=A0A3M7RKB7_BRAPC|nr:hypothetical protein BpHYR1_038656 [Brachionus plicatilis]